MTDLVIKTETPPNTEASSETQTLIDTAVTAALAEEHVEELAETVEELTDQVEQQQDFSRWLTDEWALTQERVGTLSQSVETMSQDLQATRFLLSELSTPQTLEVETETLTVEPETLIPLSTLEGTSETPTEAIRDAEESGAAESGKKKRKVNFL